MDIIVDHTMDPINPAQQKTKIPLTSIHTNKKKDKREGKIKEGGQKKQEKK